MGNIALIGKKLGMTVIFNGSVATPVTLVQVLPNVLLEVKTHKNKIKIVLAGGDIVKEKKINKPQKKQFQTIDQEFRKVIKEFEVNISKENLKIGQIFTINDYLNGCKIDVRSISKGKGFQGAMKRWGFAGMPASHGVSLTHRSLGSTGNRTEPGRVFKNKKMAGHMGDRNVCVQNLEIHTIDKDNSIIAIAGTIPGAENSTVFINNSIKAYKQNKILNGIKV